MGRTRRSIVRASALAFVAGQVFAVVLPAAVMGMGWYSVGSMPLSHGLNRRPDLARVTEFQEPRSWIVTGVRREISGPGELDRIVLAAKQAMGEGGRPGHRKPPEEYEVERSFGFPIRSMGYTITWMRDGGVVTRGAAVADDLRTGGSGRTAALHAWPMSARMLPLLANFFVVFVPVTAVMLTRSAIVLRRRRRRGQCPSCGHASDGLAQCPECGE
jgi:hypothetical protein